MFTVHTAKALPGQQSPQPRQHARSGTPTTQAQANSKDFMKSTWRRQNRSEWTIYHWLFEIVGVHPTYLDNEIPVHQKEEKVPHMHEWSLHRWIILHAFVPIILQHLYVTWTGRNFTAWQAAFFYSAALQIISIHEFYILRRISHQTGFLDGDVHERDGCPMSGVICTVFLSYYVSQVPADMGWLWLPLEAGLYGIVLDFWFYSYHRLMHEVASLWKYHRTHHLTKHPNPLLTLYADTEQEFSILSASHSSYLVFAELVGHSGLRLYLPIPNTLNPLLCWFNCELIIEDHDLHHRKGWKSSGNYGKQTRLWDRIFGTCKDRIECRDDNIDWENTITMPLL
ncbi:fatty acid hydroxylase superfamily protein [Hirsutella rhossiliensis]|uniref:Fatty acid hydroxylase superfamily domain-containing protein n=1 Tax=Hirsutella rhossiliensis TaxID=111463 RepID=A0A9P8MVA7_9HYPO|nr:fatty acid hydroxylase superfamily domain-containing protein [Hirsutella rhossiliensis]KAH0962057.1 fatty acid hydroxylase superfamily domain-containing protein [Hirsutella rhossiliensis]